MILKINKHLRNRRGQSVGEAAAVITIVLGAALAMSTYFRRSIMSGVKTASDQLGPQFEPDYVESLTTNNRHSAETKGLTGETATVASNTAVAGTTTDKDTTLAPDSSVIVP